MTTAEQITVNLTGAAVVALHNTAATLDLSVTDTVNQALQAYAYLIAVQNSGGEVYVRETPDSERQVLRFSQGPGEAA